MSAWQDVKRLHAVDRVVLGPSTSYQWLNDRKHLLFVLARYKHAARLIGDADTVLEVGCGEGIGAPLLAEGRRACSGIDPDGDAIYVARATAASGPLQFAQATVDQVRYQYGAVVSLDVIEHVPTADAEAFVAGCAKVLPPSGVCVIGTPNETAAAYQSESSRLGHVNLYDAGRLERLMRQHFRHVVMFGMNDEALTTGFLPMAHYLMALGVGPR